MKKRILSVFIMLCAFSTVVSAQSTEVKITLSEQFFEALFEAVFTHLDEPSVAINEEGKSGSGCNETIRLKKQMDGVKTAVRFRQGKIYAPIAFEGSYSPPLIGCVDFRGWAETNIVLSFDPKTNAIVGRAEVLKVNLSGTNGIGSSLLARFVQNSIDEKVNPIEIVRLNKLSFVTPVKDSGKLRMKAKGFEHQVTDQNLDIVIKYDFEKAD